MTATELHDFMESSHAIVLDIRLGRAFTEAHVPGALSAPFSQRGWGTQVATWVRQEAAGKPLVLFGDNKVITASASKALEAENLEVSAVWDQGLDPWRSMDLPLVSVESITIDALHGELPTWKVIDVREPYEHRTGIIPGAITIPMGQLADRAGELDKDQRYAIVCASGNRSQSAAAWMAEEGYRVANVVGGMSLWLGAGHPVVQP